MGYFRFRRRIKIAPGVHWNIGKKGSSLSFGGRGVTYTMGPQGSRTTVGIPGTGVSYTHVQSHSPPTTPSTTAAPSPSIPPSVPAAQYQTPSRPAKVFYVFGTILLVIWMVSKLGQYTGTSNVKQSVSASPTTLTPYNTYSPNPSYSSSVFPRAMPVEPAAPPSTSLLTTPQVATYRVAKDAPGGFLNLRGGPGSTYAAVVQIRAGTGGIRRVAMGRVRNGPTTWQKIAVGSYIGWVNEIYLEVEPEIRRANPVPAESESQPEIRRAQPVPQQP
jgi:hypothetical protein